MQVSVLTRTEIEEIARAAAEAALRIQKDAGYTRDVFTADQLAERFQVTKQAVMNWTKRDGHKNPLPVHFLGTEARFIWSEVLEWTREETRRKRGTKGVSVTDTVQ
jgi:hypothetical protein